MQQLAFIIKGTVSTHLSRKWLIGLYYLPLGPSSHLG